MGLEDLAHNVKKEVGSEQDESESENELTDSLKLLIERDNPMADAAERALELL